MSKRKRYKLYAGQVQDIPQGVIYSFIPSHHRYLLIYTDKDPNEKLGEKRFVEVPQDIPLTPEESSWLVGCKMSINVRFIEQNKSECIDFMNVFMDSFEAELRIEAEKAKQD